MRRAAEKRVTLEQAAACARRWQAQGERVVLANGVFDLLHVGHVRYLQDAVRPRERLIVALNDDRATARLKGPGRPVLPAEERATLVAALRVVDAVLVFDEDSAATILEMVRPDVHAKGTDYAANTVPERDVSAALGIETRIAGDPKRHASREVVERVRRPRA